MHAPLGALGPSQTHDQCTRNNGRRIYASIKEFMQARRIYASTTVLRASLLSDFHIQRYCQWYGCSMAYFDKGRRGFGNSSKCREKFGTSLCFSSTNFPANIVSVHFVWRFTANLVSVRGTETGGAQRRAASAKQLHFSSPHWPLVNNGGFLGNEAVKR